jgi:hypothetical protein
MASWLIKHRDNFTLDLHYRLFPTDDTNVFLKIAMQIELSLGEYKFAVNLYVINSDAFQDLRKYEPSLI